MLASSLLTRLTGVAPTDSVEPSHFPSTTGLLTRLGRPPGEKTTVAVGLFGFMILKVLVVANLDLSVALGILRAVGPVPVLVGSLVSGFRAVAPGVMAWYAGHPLARRSGLRERVDVYWPLATSLMLGVLFTPAIVFVPLALAAVSGPIRRYAAGRARGRAPRLNRPLALSFKLVIVLLVVFAAREALHEMWLPHERLTLETASSGEPSLVGSVLEDNGNWMAVLKSGSRALVRVRASAVRSRALCSKEDFPSTARYLGLHATSPTCPKPAVGPRPRR